VNWLTRRYFAASLAVMRLTLFLAIFTPPFFDVGYY
jgi:hypothetical protein